MSQFSFSIPNGPGASFRADVNSGLQALATLSSGSTAPTTTYAYQFWADTSTSPATLRQRNGANSAWVVVGSLDTANWGLAPVASPTFTGTVTLPTVTVSGNMTFSSTGFLDLPVGTTAQRPGSPSAGMIRYNSTLNQFEGYGTAWGSIGGGATGGGSDRVFNENDQTVTTDYTITTNRNAVSAGPVTINSGITVTIPSGSNWAIV